MSEKFPSKYIGKSKNLEAMDTEKEKRFREVTQAIQDGDFSDFAEFKEFFKDPIAREIEKYEDMLDPLTKDELQNQLDAEMLIYAKTMKMPLGKPFVYAAIKDAIPELVARAVRALGNQEEQNEGALPLQEEGEEILAAEADRLVTLFEQSDTAEDFAAEIGKKIDTHSLAHNISRQRAAFLLPYLFGEEGATLASVGEKAEVTPGLMLSNLRTLRTRIKQAMKNKDFYFSKDLNKDESVEHFMKKLSEELGK